MTTFDTHSPLAYSEVQSVVSQSGTTLVITVTGGQGALFAIDQQVTIWPNQEQALFSNAMIGRITAIAADQLTIDYSSANLEGTNVRTVLVTDQISNTVTPKALKDIEDAVNNINFAPVRAFLSVSRTAGDGDYICDGTADDVQIQAANDAAAAAGGGVVYIKAGTYNLAARVNVSSNVAIIGENKLCTLNLASGAGIWISSVSNVLIKNLTTDATNQVSGLTGSATDMAIKIINSSDVRILDNEVLNNTSFGVFISSETSGTTQRVSVKGNHLTGRGNSDIIGGGTDGTSILTDVWVEDNLVYQDASLGALYATAIDIVGVTRTTVAGNKTYGSIYFGGEQGPQTYSNIINNAIYPANSASYCVLGINAANVTNVSKRLVVSGNMIYNGYIFIDGGVGSKMYDCIVSNNTIEGAASYYGIRFNAANGGSCIGNNINGGTIGISIYGSAKIAVLGNLVRGTSTASIKEESASDYNTFIGNICTDNTSNPIVTIGAHTVAANNINT